MGKLQAENVQIFFTCNLTVVAMDKISCVAQAQFLHWQKLRDSQKLLLV